MKFPKLTKREKLPKLPDDLYKEPIDYSNIIVGDYIAYAGVFDAFIYDLDRKSARKEFNNFIEHKDERISQIKTLLALNGLKLSGYSEDIKDINQWVIDNICYSKDEFYIDDDDKKQYFIHPMWSNVIFDLSIFLSELVIQNTDNVSWHFNITVPKNEISYQQPVLNGFSKVKDKYYYHNFGLALFNLAKETLENRDEATPHHFNYIVEAAIIEDIDLEETMFEHETHEEHLRSLGFDN